MTKRKKAREMALKLLYSAEMQQVAAGEAAQLIQQYCEDNDIKDSRIIAFALTILQGVLNNLEDVDIKINGAAINWPLERMACLDRNILRMGIYEMFFIRDIPLLVTINESIELAKKYCSLESSKFINGVLHNLKEQRIAEQKEKV